MQTVNIEDLKLEGVEGVEILMSNTYPQHTKMFEEHPEYMTSIKKRRSSLEDTTTLYLFKKGGECSLLEVDYYHDEVYVDNTYPHDDGHRELMFNFLEARCKADIENGTLMSGVEDPRIVIFSDLTGIGYEYLFDRHYNVVERDSIEVDGKDNVNMYFRIGGKYDRNS